MVDDEEETEAPDASLDEILAKRAEEKGEDEEEESVIELTREERAESLAIKVLPQQADEFTCRNCFLVKHRSQLADRKKIICKDCA
ncbi:MAG TPA: DUF4193 family protein [Actinomycetota bacterium]|nr:DUF4193 family protein [Actinomycetota bacterium]